MKLVCVLTITIVAAGAACGFDCNVQGETQHFNDCEALQEGFDALDPTTDAAARDDIDTCGELVGCEIEP